MQGLVLCTYIFHLHVPYGRKWSLNGNIPDVFLFSLLPLIAFTGSMVDPMVRYYFGRFIIVSYK